MLPVITYLVLSDIHLGKRGRTSEILKALRWFFSAENKNYALIKSCDIIFLAGDLFDKAISLKDVEIADIFDFIFELMDFCKRHGIILRVLEGTTSHDFHQSRILDVIFKNNFKDSDFDFAYIDKIKAEVFSIKGEEFSVLYIPDNYGKGAADNLREAKRWLKNFNLEKFNAGIYHGFFDFQLPPNTSEAIAHNVKEHMDIVDGYICIGHDHSHKLQKRVIVQGSFDRLAHGEESKKGGVLCSYVPACGEYPSRSSFTFIENKKAKIYKTLTFKNPDHDVSLKQLADELEKIPPSSNIRIRCSKTHVLFQALDEIKLIYPEYTFIKLAIEDEKEQESLIDLLSSDESPRLKSLALTRENIVGIVTDEVMKTKNLAPEKQFRLTQLLAELQN